MITFADLWLPILVSAVFVFVASSLIHMALQIHKGDYEKLPNEAAFLDSLRKAGVRPGQFMFPCPGSMKEMGSAEMQAKFQQGPVGSMVVRPSGPPFMGKALGQWFAFCLVVAVFVAYLSKPLGHGAEGMVVFRRAGIAAVLGYAFSSVTDSIWKGVKWGTTLKFIFDGIVYAIVTGATFAWLWPATA